MSRRAVFRLALRRAFNALDQPCAQLGKRSVQHVPPGDNDIVVSVLHCNRGRLLHGGLEAPSHAVAFNGVAVLLCNGVSDPRRIFRRLSIENLEKEGATAANFSIPHGEELRPAFKPPDSFLVVRLVRHRPDVSGISALGRETLAAT